SLGMLIDRPLSIAVRSAGLLAGSAPLLRAATEISRMILVKILPRLASEAFLRASMEGPRPMGKLRSCWKAGDFTGSRRRGAGSRGVPGAAPAAGGRGGGGGGGGGGG